MIRVLTSLPRSASVSGYPDRTTERAALSVDSLADAWRGQMSGSFRGYEPEMSITSRVSNMGDPMQPLTSRDPGSVQGEVPDNDTLCPRTYAEEPVTAYRRLTATRCRLVVTRDQHRTNTAAHLYVDGGAQLAIITAKGVAGTVELAVAGEHLEELIDSLIEAWVNRP